ncbi:MAG: hypothetical protein ABIV07_02990 [Polaromonas sp.]
MATSSIVGGSKLPEEISGKDMQALGPSDNSDSGSDVVGAYDDEQLASDSDACGTGEGYAVGQDRGQPDADILPDHIEMGSGNETEQDLHDLDEVENLADDSQDPQANEGDEEAGRSGTPRNTPLR